MFTKDDVQTMAQLGIDAAAGLEGKESERRPRARYRKRERTLTKGWIVEALEHFGGSASVLDVSKFIWETHEAEIMAQGDMFYTWQYDVRWSAKVLRDEGVMVPAGKGSRAPWALTTRS